MEGLFVEVSVLKQNVKAGLTGPAIKGRCCERKIS